MTWNFRILARRVPGLGRLLDGIHRTRVSISQPEPGWPAGHFYSPVPSLDAVRARESEIFHGSRDLSAIDLNDQGQCEWLTALAPYFPDQPFPATSAGDTRFYFENPNYSYGEATVYQAFLRYLRPRRVIEIGSGFSTMVLLDTVERFLPGSVDCTSIEPETKLLRSLLRAGDERRVKIVEEQLQSVDKSLFTQLDEGDILFVDSTHVSKIDSDVNHILFEILPRLRRGVFIHIHDIYYPFEYPKKWIYEGRAWNEAYLVRAFLMYNHSFRIQFFNDYIRHEHLELMTAVNPLFLKSPGSSLWLRKEQA
jgi:predicted O-methyltransferase YrrM